MTKTAMRQLKIKLENHFLTEEDLKDIRRWEDEGGATTQALINGLLSSRALPLHKKEIFEVTDSDILAEDGQLYLLVDINILSLY